MHGLCFGFGKKFTHIMDSIGLSLLSSGTMQSVLNSSLLARNASQLLPIRLVLILMLKGSDADLVSSLLEQGQQ